MAAAAAVAEPKQRESEMEAGEKQEELSKSRKLLFLLYGRDNGAGSAEAGSII